MRDEHIEEMVRQLKPALKDPVKAKVILQRYWRTRMALVWAVDAVHRAANERGRAITNHEAVEILQTLHEQHNPQLGLRWADLWDHLDLYQPGRKLNRAETKQLVHHDRVTVAK